MIVVLDRTLILIKHRAQFASQGSTKIRTASRVAKIVLKGNTTIKLAKHSPLFVNTVRRVSVMRIKRQSAMPATAGNIKIRMNKVQRIPHNSALTARAVGRRLTKAQ
jgi:hypothetical protein